MPSSDLERAERAIAAIRDQSELSPATVEALELIVGAIQSVDRRLATLEGIGIGKRASPPTAPNAIHHLNDHDADIDQIRAIIGGQYFND